MKFFRSRTYAIAALVASALVACFFSVPAAAATFLAASAAAHLAITLESIDTGAIYRLGLINTTVVANTIQPKYSKKLLDYAVQETRLAEFAMQEELEPGAGATSVRFFRPPQADLTATGAPAALTEGTAPTNFRAIAFTPVDVALAQRGEVAKVTDIANTVGLVKYLNTAIQLMGEEFALDVDTLVRNQLCHPTTGMTKRYAQGLANFAAISPATLANARLLPQDFLDSLTRLKINRAPKVNGVYVAIIPPQGTRDILNNSEFREVVRQNYADRIFKGEIGDFYGCRFIEGTNPFQEDETEGTFASTFSGAGTNTTGLVYTTIVTGKGAYGTVNMKKLGATIAKPQVVIVDKADSGNPLNQWITVGWKAFWASTVLNANWGIALRHKSQFA